ncbi:CrcB family protein [Corynebacterium caspium]|uniref:CrcB family protein n=1 Tax=Corynebacterium caspium TaxID=234828 RepID=UPI0003773081|nr:CrcB family protein [Corynebacterium caspium]WKD58765.1 camphor resistance protein CrcB [Corynebacterium caspium DSM 44850]
MNFQSFALVGAGAAIGAVARMSALAAFPNHVWTLVGINILGSLIMGYLQPGLFWGKGVLGGFTSFSSFTKDIFSLSGIALVLPTTILGCLSAWLLGYYLHSRRNPLAKEA